jgi:hypothetical protein
MNDTSYNTAKNTTSTATATIPSATAIPTIMAAATNNASSSPVNIATVSTTVLPTIEPIATRILPATPKEEITSIQELEHEIHTYFANNSAVMKLQQQPKQAVEQTISTPLPRSEVSSLATLATSSDAAVTNGITFHCQMCNITIQSGYRYYCMICDTNFCLDCFHGENGVEAHEHPMKPYKINPPISI